MHFSTAAVASLAISLPVLALPRASSSSSLQNAADAVPGETSLFVTYPGKETPLAQEYLRANPATGSGPAGDDDLLFQNLLAAEWVIYSFYQLGVESFTKENFTKLGWPNTTYERIVEIRDNEAGHVRIFQDQITNNSVKPAPCKYQFEVGTNPEYWLLLQTYLEASSMAFLTGLALQADVNTSKAALMAIGQTESRHNTWSLIDVWNVSPFAGPSDTTYPYPNQILDLTNNFIVPRQNLPQLEFYKNGTTASPGSDIQLAYQDPKHVPSFEDDKQYWVVFYHGVQKVSLPFDPHNMRVKIPAQFDVNVGIIMLNIADEEDAPTRDSVVAGPLILLEQPVAYNKVISAV
ncbi:hypothetical protein N7532_006045 [Penicillium argentinense]|uniref:Uncharacterized protein n=1 Tax=Penicillium argentinense TaxID=1131581 RepID=A0A9W9KAD9_9EURO|nr:uncharacterized protein N7532_006045 [Penicillium argentinense]KAJ5099044.1 hypothetical protein N7532_006045 [Penicillium argentinense]